MTKEEIEHVVAASRASQNKLELGKVLKYVDEIQPVVIVEIGTHKGYSLEVWHAAWPQGEVIGIGNEPIDPAIAPLATFIEGDSHAQPTLERLQEALRGRPIDFLFIDGDHTYEGVKKDHAMYSPLVRHGGIIGFHDINLASDEWRMAGVDVNRFFYYELIAVAGCKYLEFWDQIGKGTGTGLFFKP